MNDTSPNTQRIAFVSALFGVLALIVALWALGFGYFGAFLIGLIVAAVVWAILWMGWKSPQGDVSAEPKTQSAAPVTATATKTPVTAPVASEAVAPAPVEKPVVEKTAAKPAVAKAAAKPAVVKAAAKPVVAKAAAKPVVAKAAVKPVVVKAAAKPVVVKVAAKPAVVKTEDKPAKAKPATRAKKKPVVLEKAREGGPDDLKMIKGVGPVLEKALHEAGVFHFDQIGAWTIVDARWFDENVKGANGRVVRDEWIKQARILAKGGKTDFSKKVKKGGVY